MQLLKKPGIRKHGGNQSLCRNEKEKNDVHRF